MGADVGIGGRDGDWSVAHVLNSKKRPDYLADILAALGRYYNSALPMGHCCAAALPNP